MAFAGLTITSQRETVVDFSIPFWYETSSVAVHVSLIVKAEFRVYSLSTVKGTWILSTLVACR